MGFNSGFKGLIGSNILHLVVSSKSQLRTFDAWSFYCRSQTSLTDSLSGSFCRSQQRQHHRKQNEVR